MRARNGWGVDDIPDLGGKIVLVTGANSGLGLHTALALAGKGAEVTLACRSMERGEEAADVICNTHPGAHVRVLRLDLASLESVYEAAERFLSEHACLHILCNNAGVMALPRSTTSDGFELQLGINHLGHFALTGRLLGLLQATASSRVVTISSAMHRIARLDLTDLHGERRYRKWSAYGNSKLANLLFAYELQRRADAAACQLLSLASHPGYAATNLQTVGPRMAGSRFKERSYALAGRLFAQDAASGALPTLYAATAPDVRGGEFFGPGGLMELRGAPTRVRSSDASRDEALALRLWEISEELTGERFAFAK